MERNIEAGATALRIDTSALKLPPTTVKPSLRLEPRPWERAAISKSYAYELMSAGLFPTCVKLGRASRWVVEEVDAFIAARLAERGVK